MKYTFALTIIGAALTAGLLSQPAAAHHPQVGCQNGPYTDFNHNKKNGYHRRMHDEMPASFGLPCAAPKLNQNAAPTVKTLNGSNLTFKPRRF